MIENDEREKIKIKELIWKKNKKVRNDNRWMRKNKWETSKPKHTKKRTNDKRKKKNESEWINEEERMMRPNEADRVKNNVKTVLS